MTQGEGAAISTREKPVHIRANEGVDGATGDLEHFLLGLEEVELEILGLVCVPHSAHIARWAVRLAHARGQVDRLRRLQLFERCVEDRFACTVALVEQVSIALTILDSLNLSLIIVASVVVIVRDAINALGLRRDPSSRCLLRL